MFDGVFALAVASTCSALLLPQAVLLAVPFMVAWWQHVHCPHIPSLIHVLSGMQHGVCAHG